MFKLGTSLAGDMPPAEQMKIIGKAGFDSVMINCFEEESVKPWADAREKSGVFIELVHAPILHASDFWVDTADGDDFLACLKRRVDFCRELGAPIMVVHTTFKKPAPPVSQIGVDRFLDLCDYAQNSGVKLAFENVDVFEHLEKVMNVLPPFHGFCWDSGHNLCYAPEKDMSELFGSRLICTHIHDNFGRRRPGCPDSRDDMHLLPFDGTMDWQWYAERIKNIGYRGTLTIEFTTKYMEKYRSVSFEELTRMEYAAAAKLRDLCD